MFEIAPGDAHLIFDREWLADGCDCLGMMIVLV